MPIVWRFSLGLALLLPAGARADWRELRCHNPETSELFVLGKSAGVYRAATQHTQAFLLGLSCELPKPDLPLFRCEGPEGLRAELQSAFVLERGFPEGEQKYVERESFRIFLRYRYAGEGEGEAARTAFREWSFTRSQCEWR